MKARFTEVIRRMAVTSVKATKNEMFFVAFFVEDRGALLYSENDMCSGEGGRLKAIPVRKKKIGAGYLHKNGSSIRTEVA